MPKSKGTSENDAELMHPLNQEVIIEQEILDHERPAWGSKFQYFGMVISTAVGLGNVWRFPYLCQQHGGGAFLIPYLIMLFVEGMPLLYLEFAAGQHFRKGSMGTWNLVHPMLGGVGVASAVTSFIVGVYYNAIIMWCLFYLVHSFTGTLPWSSCPMEPKGNITVPVLECDVSGPTSYFWYRNALEVSPSIEETQGLKWKMLLCLIFAWCVVYACIWKGIKSSGKVVYVTASFPYIVLFIFLGRGVTLRGAGAGLAHMFTPRLDRLEDPQVWLDAATQIFYSFGLGFGGMIGFSSYNPKKNNCEKDAIIVSIVNWFTAILASVVIFSVLGFKASVMYDKCILRNIETISNLYPEWNTTTLTEEIYLHEFQANKTVMSALNLTDCSLKDDLDNAAQGTGLAFIVFTEAINEFGSSAPFWSIIFFLMLLSLGFGSEFGTLEGVTASLYDLKHPIFRKKWLVSGTLCLVSMLIGILFVLGSGSYWVGLFDSFGGSFPLITVALVESFGIGWVYGVDNFARDIKEMIGHEPHPYWKIMWKFIAPLFIAVLLAATLISKFIKPITYSVYSYTEYIMVPETYPWWGGATAAFLVLSSVLCIPGVALARKLGFFKFEGPTSKNIVIETGGYTQSTAAFLKPDNDSGHNSDEINDEYVTRDRDTSCAIPERPEKVNFDDILDKAESKL
ncbi:sodium- and chloride-dependent transporter XTRP3-like [Saccostrea echinata]|uniref:sodium- and chloride-dependent transporter XTRP3-like n=1 Tax=Saccostrea echinata TaxID=191078 RepID=UPI002A7EA9A4|nr:sodium- and chloride-dependent transporter XTRP3-like [Saccostrea echinata]